MVEKLQNSSQEAVKVMVNGHQVAQNSVAVAAEAGTSLESIAEGMTRLNDMSTQIAAAAEQQALVTTEIDKNITNISEIADDTADGAEQTASRSKALKDLSDHLQQLVSRFKVA